MSWGLVLSVAGAVALGLLVWALLPYLILAGLLVLFAVVQAAVAAGERLEEFLVWLGRRGNGPRGWV